VPTSTPFQSSSACRFDPQLAPILLSPEFQPLLIAAQMYIISLGSDRPIVQNNEAAESTSSKALGRFRFLAAKIQNSTTPLNASASECVDTVPGQLKRYLAEVGDSQNKVPAAEFWRMRPTYSALGPITEDLIHAPASQAFVERIFSLWNFNCWKTQQDEQFSGNESFLKLNTALCSE
jgi:hypothetical protein